MLLLFLLVTIFYGLEFVRDETGRLKEEYCELAADLPGGASRALYACCKIMSSNRDDVDVLEASPIPSGRSKTALFSLRTCLTVSDLESKGGMVIKNV